MDINNSNQKYVYQESDIVTPDYCGRRGQKTTISDVSVKKRVLLVCVYNKRGTLITHDIIYRLFMKYGEIHKILIFDKCKNWKIFVEMATLEQAEKARDGLNNFQLFDDGSKMTVYYAKVDQIVFQNNNSGGVDYRELKLRKNLQSPGFQSSGVNSSQNLSSGGLGGSPGLYGIGNEIPIKKQSLANTSSRNSISNGLGENPTLTEKHRNNSFDYSELYRKFESVPNTRVSPQRGSVLGTMGTKKNSLFQTIQPVQIPEGSNGINIHVDLMNEPNINSSANDISNCEFDEGNNPNQIHSDSQRINFNNSQNSSDEESGRNDNSSPQSANDVEKNSVSGGQINLKSNNDCKSGNNTALASSNNFNNDGNSNPVLIPNGNQLAQAIINNNQEIGSFSSTNNNPENLVGTQLGLFNKGYQFDDEEEDEEEGQGQIRSNVENVNEVNRIESGEGDETTGGTGLNEIDPSNYVNPLYILENKKSRVIYVRGLEKKNLTTKKIYNLFSNFGNIELILYFTEKRYCLIQFETQEDATIAKEHLDSLKVESNQMRIFYSNYETIKENQEGEKQCEIWKGEKNNFRFRNGKQISINPVTNTLHVSNLKNDTCKQEVINEKFSPYGLIEAFHPFTNQNKFMCHVKFSSAEDAINALCNLHEEEILGRKMHISFTRARISPQTTPDNNQINNNQPLQQPLGVQNQQIHGYSYRRNSNLNNINQNLSIPNNNQNMNSSPLIHQMNNGNNSSSIKQKNKNIDPNNEVHQSVNNILNDDEDSGNSYPFYPPPYQYQQNVQMQQYQQYSQQFNQYPMQYPQNHIPYHHPSQMQQNQMNNVGYYPHFSNQHPQQQMAAINMQNNNFNLFK